MKKLGLLSSTILLLLAGGCGDLAAIQVALTFPDDATQAATRELVFVTREAPKGNTTGCDSIWTTQPSGLSEKRQQMDYPNRNDLVAADVDLNKYPMLTLLVYAYPNKDITNSSPIAGGCQTLATNPNATTDITIKLSKPPVGLPPMQK